MLLPPWFAMPQSPIIHQKTNYLLTKIFHLLAIKNKMKEDGEAIGCFLGRNKKGSKLKKTSNNNIHLTVKRKRIFCYISFLRPLEFCKSFASSNLRWSLRCDAIFVTAYRCTDYCANTELSSTPARRLNIEVVHVPCICWTQYWLGSARQKHDVWTGP